MNIANREVDRVYIDEELRKHMNRTYSLVAQGLVATTATAITVSQTSLMNLFIQDGSFTPVGLIVSFAPLILLLLFMFGLVGKSLASTKTVFWVLTLCLGPSLAITTTGYTGVSVTNAALATLCMFLGASLYGYTTKKSLANVGSFMVMGLIGLIVASLINIFMASSALNFALSCVSVLIFTGLTAWETQSLKENYNPNLSLDDQDKLRYLFAINLYLNIINLFRAILNLTGSSE